MFFVRNYSRVVILVVALCSWGACYDSPVPEGFGVWGAPEGLPGWNTTPARLPSTTVGASGYMRTGDVGEWALSAAGEWQMRRFRGAFLYGYYALDSLYRQSGAMLELSLLYGAVLAGAGAGVYAEWLPGDAAWLRYRLKAGLSGRALGFTLSVLWSGFTDEIPDYPWACLYWEPSGIFSAFAQTDWNTVSVGTLLHLAWGNVETSYRFPGFAFTFGVSFGIGGFSAGINHGSSGSMPGWNSVWLEKRLKKRENFD